MWIWFWGTDYWYFPSQGQLLLSSLSSSVPWEFGFPPARACRLSYLQLQAATCQGGGVEAKSKWMGCTAFTAGFIASSQGWFVQVFLAFGYLWIDHEIYHESFFFCTFYGDASCVPGYAIRKLMFLAWVTIGIVYLCFKKSPRPKTVSGT